MRGVIAGLGLGLALILPLVGHAAPTAVVTLSDAVATALARHPDVRLAEADGAAARAAADQAAAPLLPHLGLSSGYQFGPSRQNVNQVDVPLTAVGTYALGLSAEQLIYDFDQTGSRHAAALATAAAFTHAVRQARLDVTLTVQQAFADAQAAQAQVRVCEDVVAIRRRHRDRTRHLVAIGVRAAIDLAQTDKGLATAELDLIHARLAQATARATLNQAMGSEREDAYAVGDAPPPPVPGEGQPLAVLLDEALTHRPELAATAARIEAQRELVAGAAHTQWPSLKASAGTGVNGTPLGSPNGNWNAGLGLSWPLYAGGEGGAREAQERARLAGLQALADAQRQQARLDVDQARWAVAAAQAGVTAAAAVVAAAREQLRLADARFAVGVGTMLELDDAQRADAAARADAIQEARRLARARAQLQRALGRS